MWNFIKGIFLLLIGLICIGIPISCVNGCMESCNREYEIKENNTNATVILEGPTYGEPWGDGTIVSYAHISFKNVGTETIYTITCTAIFYDIDGNSLGTQKVDYNSHKNGYEEIEYGETSATYVLSVSNKNGVKATTVKIKDYKVNGYEKVSGHE